MIDLSTGEVPSAAESGNDILIDSDVKIRMQYVVSDTDPDVGYGTRETMGVTLTASNKGGLVGLGFPDESGVIVRA